MLRDICQLDFTRPWWLAALAVLPVVLYYARRSLVRFGLLRRAASLLLRVLLLAALAAALAGARLSRETSRQFVVLAVDQSRSIAPDAGKIVEHWRSQWRTSDTGAGQGRGDRVVSVPFAAEPGAVAAELPAPPTDAPPGTNIAAAIAAARATIPDDYVPQIVLFSDGNQTTGDALAAAKAAGVPIATVPLPGPEREVYVAGVAAPGRVRAWTPFEADVAIESITTAPAPSRCASAPKSLGRRRKIPHSPGRKPRPLPCHCRGRGDANDPDRSVSDCQDTIAENNEAGCMVTVGLKPRVLLVDKPAGGGGPPGRRPAPGARRGDGLRGGGNAVAGGRPRPL